MGLILVLGSGMAVFVMIDLEFGIGPLVLLLCLVAVAVALLVGLRMLGVLTGFGHAEAARVPAGSEPQEVNFAAEQAPRVLRFNSDDPPRSFTLARSAPETVRFGARTSTGESSIELTTATPVTPASEDRSSSIENPVYKYTNPVHVDESGRPTFDVRV